MAALSDDQVKSIIINNPNKAVIAAKQAKSKKLRMHVTGDGLKAYVYDLPYFERPELKEERIKMMRSNKDLIKRTLQPREKIYVAKGGVEEYRLPPTLEPDYREYLADIAMGLPLKEWIRQKAQKAYDYDPEGLIFIEVSDLGNPYPTYKSINDVYDYELSGRRPEYVVFTVSAADVKKYQAKNELPSDLKIGTGGNIKGGDKVYRVVDDMRDLLVIRRSGKEVEIYGPGSMDNPFMPNIPAIIVSDIYGDDDGCFYSPLEEVVELLDSYMLSQSTYNISYARQAYPKEWMQATDCWTCKGEGDIGGEKCLECKGSGKLPSLKVSDTLLLDYAAPDGKNMPNPPMGSVTPAVEGLQFMHDNGVDLENMVYYTTWGMYKGGNEMTAKAKVSGKGGNVSNTAYEAQLNTQPQYDRLRLFSSWGSNLMQWIADMCGQLKYDSSYGGSAILWGDRYLLESPDATWDRYTKSVASKAPQSILDSQLLEYIENKYNNNPLMYRKYKLLMEVEPFVHLDIVTVTSMDLPLIQKLEKIYYDEWTSTLTDYDITMVGDNGTTELRDMLREYVTGHYTEGMSADTLLINPDGSILNVGDSVKVKPGHEQEPAHKGQTFTVTDVTDSGVMLSGATGQLIGGYGNNDLQKIGAVKQQGQAA